MAHRVLLRIPEIATVPSQPKDTVQQLCTLSSSQHLVHKAIHKQQHDQQRVTGESIYAPQQCNLAKQHLEVSNAHLAKQSLDINIAHLAELYLKISNTSPAEQHLEIGNVSIAAQYLEIGNAHLTHI